MATSEQTHNVTVKQAGGWWHVTCSCGYWTYCLSSHEAADDANFHLGRPSSLGGDF